MRFVKLQLLLLLVVVLVAAALGADFVLKSRAEAELTTRIEKAAPEATGVRSRIRSFPFVGRLLVSGKVSQVDVMAQHSDVAGVELSDIRLRLEGVEMDSAEARHGRAVVRSIERGSVQADLPQGQINSRLPKQFQVQVEKGRAVVTGPGGAQAQLSVTPEGTVKVSLAGRALLDLPLPKTSLLPCRPSAGFVPGALRLTCDFTDLPAFLVNAPLR